MNSQVFSALVCLAIFNDGRAAFQIGQEWLRFACAIRQTRADRERTWRNTTPPLELEISRLHTTIVKMAPRSSVNETASDSQRCPCRVVSADKVEHQLLLGCRHVEPAATSRISTQTDRQYLVYISIPSFILATRPQNKKKKISTFFLSPHNNEILNALFCLCHTFFFHTAKV